jgi:signal transduction histidine kinase
MAGTIPLWVYLSPDARQRFMPSLATHLPRGAVLAGPEPVLARENPGILVITDVDVQSKGSDTLREVAALCAPARPVLVGGTANRDVLMAAINSWQVGQVLPATSTTEDIAVAIIDAHEALAIDATVVATLGDLSDENTRLEAAIARLRETQGQLLHAERLSTVGRITGGLIVALRRHLAALDALEAPLRGDGGATDPEVAALVDAAFDGVRGISTLIDEIHACAEHRENALSMAVVPLDSLIGRIVAFARYDRLGRERVVESELRSRALVEIDHHRLWQAVINLLRNAFQATAEFSTIRVSTWVEGLEAIVAVADSGTGIPEDVKRRIFDPFFTTKGDGMGLGLHVTRLSLERQGARIECDSTPGLGTTFRIRMPLRGFTDGD